MIKVMAGLKIRNLTKVYKLQNHEIYALKNIDLDIKDESFVTIVGKSGCGKTTLLRIICGLEYASQGTVKLINGEHDDKSKIAMVFQEPRLMPWLNVEQNIALSCINKKNQTQTKAMVAHYIDMLGLSKFKKAYPSQLSGGMAQRAALGRTLCYNPDVILMDEPLGALDAFTRRKLQGELVNIFLNQRKTIVFVTHDIDEAVLLGEKVIIMDEGAVKRKFLVNIPYPRNPLSQEFCQLKEEILQTILSNQN